MTSNSSNSYSTTSRTPQPGPTTLSSQFSTPSRSGPFSAAPSLSSSSSGAKYHHLTVASLLDAHATAPNPANAALEQAVSERNLLSSQNAQLWKLIEKQRSGYNSASKDNERLRKERDELRLKLQALGGMSAELLTKKGKSLKSPYSSSALQGGTGGIVKTSASDSTMVPVRAQSDDRIASPLIMATNLPSNAFTLDHTLSPSKSKADQSQSEDPATPRSTHHIQQPNSNVSYTDTKPHEVSPPPSSPPIRPTQNTPGLPLILPALSESQKPSVDAAIGLPEPATASVSQPSGLHQISLAVRSESSSPTPTASPVRPPNTSSLRKEGFSDTPNVPHPLELPLHTANSIPPNLPDRDGSPQSSHGSPLSTYGVKPQLPSASTGLSNMPQPVLHNGIGQSTSISGLPLQNHGNPLVNQGQTTTQSISSPRIPLSSLPNTTGPLPSLQGPRLLQSTQSTIYDSPNAHPPQRHSPNLKPTQTTLAPPSSGFTFPSLEDSRRNLSRESRISLPPEARQYIANMGESPFASPETGSDLSPQGHQSIRPKNALSVNDNLLDSTGLRVPSATPSHSSNTTELRNGQPSSSGKMTPLATSKQEQDSEFLDMNDEDGDGDIDDEESDSVPQVAVDFPLPPSFTHPQPQPQAMTQAQAQAHAQAQASFARAHAQTHAQTQAQLLAHAQTRAQAQQEAREQAPTGPSNRDVATLSSLNTNTAAFRALPLLSSDLPYTQIQVSHSSIRPNDRGKEVVSFIIVVDPGQGKDIWKIEKLYSDVLSLDQRMRSSVGKGVGKKIGNLPEGKLWRDHAPAKVDQRKTLLENYLRSLINLPVKNKDEVIAFFTSDIVRETRKPIMQAGYKEGYLTKRGKNFGGWKSRYFVLQGPVLEYYESRGGTHLGSISIAGAQIGRQQRSGDRREADEEKEYRHAFLIIEAKKSPGNSHRHVLCAESDADRDSWVDELVRYIMGSYHDEPVAAPHGPSPIATNGGLHQSRSSASSNDPSPASAGRRQLARGSSRDDLPKGPALEIIAKGPAVPISQLAPDASNAKLFQTPSLLADDKRDPTPGKIESYTSTRQSSDGPYAKRALTGLERGQVPSALDVPLSTSLPTSSPLDGLGGEIFEPNDQRSNSEMGHYTDMQAHRHLSPDRQRTREKSTDIRKSYHPTLGAVPSSPTNHPVPEQGTPSRGDATAKVKISGPIGGTPIPAGYKFGGKDATSEASGLSRDERKEKAKSRSFWGFGKGVDKNQATLASYPPRAVFGVPLEDSLDVVQIANLPAIIFRCIQYLEAKKAEQEEGIYRLSGSSAVIKSLKDRFNTEGDVDLLDSDEYWDPHAIAGLLKTFLRELPASILTRDLHLRFLAVIDFVDPQERIQELSQLIGSLPLANYSLLRALTAHLILVVQNSGVNKMTMRNVGIVFSPTLGIPAGVFSLMLCEFNRVFNVDAGKEDPELLSGPESVRRAADQSKVPYDIAAERLLGMSGRSLAAAPDDSASDDSASEWDDSALETTENEATLESSGHSSSKSSQPSLLSDRQATATVPDTPTQTIQSPSSKAAQIAANRGLNLSLNERSNRHSRILGLPLSPHPARSPNHPQFPNGSGSPALRTQAEGAQ